LTERIFPAYASGDAMPRADDGDTAQNSISFAFS
jgi:hypothetical protein